MAEVTEQFLVIYMVDYARDWSTGEFDVIEGTLDEVRQEVDRALPDHGRVAAKIYRLGEPLCSVDSSH